MLRRTHSCLSSILASAKQRAIAWRSARTAAAFLACLLLFAITGPVPHALGDTWTTDGPYHIVAKIAAPDALWDYHTVDPVLRRLYIGRLGGVLALDLDTQKVTPILVPSAFMRGVALIGDTNLAAGTNYEANSVSIFDRLTGHVSETIQTGKGPDALIFEPTSGLILTMNEDSHDTTVIDPKKAEAVTTIPLGGKPEFPVADGKGLVFDNIEDQNQIVAIDVQARKVARTIPLPGCRSPTGLAYDAPDSLLISSCLNGVVAFVDVNSGTVQKTFTIGEHPDGVHFDAVRRRVFVPSAADGMLNIFFVRSANNIVLEQKLPTQMGARTGAVDPVTGQVYLATGQFLPKGAPGDLPTLVPGSFRILVVGLK
jgi:DNA-binding beta-propeller fold protein YncE